jgi:hypothetical protein
VGIPGAGFPMWAVRRHLQAMKDIAQSQRVSASKVHNFRSGIMHIKAIAICMRAISSLKMTRETPTLTLRTTAATTTVGSLRVTAYGAFM